MNSNRIIVARPSSLGKKIVLIGLKIVSLLLILGHGLVMATMDTFAAEVNKQDKNGMTTTNNELIKPGIVLPGQCLNGAKFIDKMLAAAFNLSTYSSDYQMLVYKDKTPIKETGTMYFHKPRLFRVEVKTGPKKGSLAILCADGKVHGHLGGVFKYFQATVSANSDLAKAINNFPMVGTDFYSLSEYLKNMLSQGDGSLVTNEPILTTKTKTATYVLDMYSSKSISSNNSQYGLLKRIYVDPQTFLPLVWEDYMNGKLRSQSSWYNLQTNIKLSDNLFRL